MKNRNINNHDNWETPSYLYDKLNKEFNFDFDPCPICFDEITPDKDGLLIEWGQRNFVNPPYSRKLKKHLLKKQSKNLKKESYVFVCYLLVQALFYFMIIFYQMRMI